MTDSKFIELVIKIPEWKYKSICEGVEASKRCGVIGIDPDIHEAIYNGTPLPKGHGDLKDVDWVLNKMDNADADTLPRTPNEYYAWNFAQSLLKQTPTIIEADKKIEADKDMDNEFER